MKQILLTMIALSGILLADFTRSGDIVTDTTTGLAWQDDAAAASTARVWSGAINYCENTLAIGGYTDWRLPNKKEPLSIVDRSRNDPAIDIDVFDYTALDDHYWSSTTYEGDTGDAWTVGFDEGDSYYSDKTYYTNYVRCVRGGL